MTSVADVAEMGTQARGPRARDGSADESRADGLLAEYGRLRTRFEAKDGYNIESQARRVPLRPGFHEEDMERSTDEFSGGWQMRIALFKLLLRARRYSCSTRPHQPPRPPESVRWLENFLKSYRGAVLVVSHDRAFMNGMVDHVAEIANGKLDIYTGNYDAYLVQRDEARARLLAMKEAQDREIAHMEAFVEKFRYKGDQGKAGPGPRQEARANRAHRDSRGEEETAFRLSPARAHG